MYTVRRSGLTGLLAAIALLLGVITPSVAQADEATGWPLHLVTGMTPTSMAAFGNDSLSFANCSNSLQANSFQYVYEGKTESTLPTSQVGTASPPHEGVQCVANQGLMTADGTFYTTYVKEDASGVNSLSFVAMKNGRMSWSSDLASQNDPICSSMSSWGSEAHDEVMTYASQGSDGNIYGIVQQNNPGCATYLAGISGVDGHVIFKQSLTSDGAFKSARAWVYGDKILTISYTGVLRQFNYDGTENTSAAYQFPMATIGTINTSYANADGRVFVTGTGTGSDTVIGYYDPSGMNGTINSGLGSNPGSHFTPGAGGTFVAVNNLSGAVTTYHFASTGITVTSASGLSYSTDHAAVTNYWQDSNGNAVEVRQLLDSNWAPAGVTADEIDGTTGAVANLLLVGVDGTHPSPSLNTADISPDGYLYAVICHNSSVSTCGNTSGSSLDGWVHKVQTTGLGSPIKDTGSFTTYTNPNRIYAALGDSFSSGESNSPFLAGTDDTGYDMCHRSSAAYPSLLANQVTDLSLTDFVACSGSETNDITSDSGVNNQANHEPAQIHALDDRTRVVTLTIGGNDIDFVDFANACVFSDCGSGSTAYSNAINAIAALPGVLKPTYEKILQAAPNAQVYVLDYPEVVGPKTPSDPIDVRCPYLYDSQGAHSDEQNYPWENDYGAREVISLLDSQISTVIGQVQAESTDYAARLHYVPANDASSPFAGHGICDSGSSYFQNIDQGIPHQAYVFHPNTSGQQAYASIVAAAVGNG